MPKTKITIILLSIIAFLSLALFSIAKAETLKIGFVSDWEYGTQKEFDHKLPKKAGTYLNAAVRHYNDVFHPDLVIGGGDYILSRSVKKKKAIKQMQYINGIFKKTAAPRLYCIGNHDLSDLKESEVKTALGFDYLHSATDIKGVRIVTLDTNEPDSRNKFGVVGRVPQAELAWLDSELDTNLPVIVFSHHSPIQTQEKHSWRTNIYNAAALREVLEKYGNVVAVISGHHAINYRAELNGINYLIINNLTDKKALGSYADISVDADGDGVDVSVSQYGKKPANYNFSKEL